MFLLAVDSCRGLGPVVSVIHNVVEIIRFAVPVLLIIFGTIDLAKAVIAGKEDEMKKAQTTLIKRVIYAIALFLVVTIVIFVMGLLPVGGDDGVDTTWQQCWQNS